MDFSIIGLGYISRRHLKAIYELGHRVKYACDTHTNVGFLDEYDKRIKFYTEERDFFPRTEETDYTVVCSPNYLHCRHIAKSGSENIICEKPLVFHPNSIPTLKLLDKNINVIQQLRLHPNVIEFKKKMNEDNYYDININYKTPRGSWYRESWKGNRSLSGGLLFNIGIHLFDLLIYFFGYPVKYYFTQSPYISFDSSRGEIFFDNAKVVWNLSIDTSIPKITRYFEVEEWLADKGNKICVFDKFLLDLSDNDLHTKSYNKILNGGGFKIEDIEQSICFVDRMIHNPHSYLEDDGASD